MDALFSKGRRGNVGPLRFCFLVSEGAAGSEEMAGSGAVGSEEETGSAAVSGSSGAAGSFEVAGSSRVAGSSEEAAVSVLFSVPKKAFKKAWKRNLIKRRMRESYRRRKHALAEAALVVGRHIDIALICSPAAMKGAKGDAKERTEGGAKRGAASPEIPDFATIDNAIAKILDKILARI